MPLMRSGSKKAFNKNIESEMDAGKPQKQSLAIAYDVQRKNKRKPKKMADGGKVADDEGDTGGAKTSTSGNKTKTGGSNPGGASTGGAGTVTITTGDKPPKAISVSGVGGNTRARNAGGLDPSDEDDDMMMALGGAVESETHSGHPYDRDPGTPSKKSDNRRLQEDDYMADDWAGGPDPIRKPDDERRPKSAYIDTNEWSDGEKPSRKPFADGGEVLTSKPNAPRPSQESTESSALNARGKRGEMNPAQMAEYHEQEAAKYRMMADGGMIGEVDDEAQETQAPGTPMRKPDDSRPPKSDNMSEKWSNGNPPARKPDDMRPDKADYDSGSDARDMDEHYDSIADAILAKKRKAKMYADGGMVDLEANSREDKNREDDASYDALLKEQYDDSQISKQPMDSNEHGDEIDSDEHDMVKRIMAKMKSKRSY